MWKTPTKKPLHQAAKMVFLITKQKLNQVLDFVRVMFTLSKIEFSFFFFFLDLVIHQINFNNLDHLMMQHSSGVEASGVKVNSTPNLTYYH